MICVVVTNVVGNGVPFQKTVASVPKLSAFRVRVNGTLLTGTVFGTMEVSEGKVCCGLSRGNWLRVGVPAPQPRAMMLASTTRVSRIDTSEGVESSKHARHRGGEILSRSHPRWLLSRTIFYSLEMRDVRMALPDSGVGVAVADRCRSS